MDKNSVKNNNYKSKKAYLGMLLFFVGVLFCFSCLWIRVNFGNVSAESIVYQLKTPMVGAGNYIFSYITSALGYTLILTGIFLLVTFRLLDRKAILYTGSAVAVVGFLVFSINIGVFQYIYHQIKTTNLYDDYYVDPREVEITFPKEKRNLVFVYMESMENTYKSKDEGGCFDENLIPNLTKLQKDNISFGANGKGAKVTNKTNWTIAAMTGMTSGIPLTLPFGRNEYGNWNEFLPGVYNLGNILEKEGYNNIFCVGSDSVFGGTNHLFNQHGNYEIADYNSMIEKEFIDSGYFVWWGVEDHKLYSFAKKELDEIASRGEPFCFTLATIDTHTESGYVCSKCRSNHENQYENVIECADRQIAEFIYWLKQQDYYENTTVIIMGDHLSMDPNFFDEIDESGYERTVYGVIINPLIADGYESEVGKININRDFCTLDMFPTTLAAIGVKIEGERLGLGTNLFSNKKTIIEEMGIDKFNEELLLRSKYYEENFMK